MFADTAQDTACIAGIDTNDGRGFDVYGNDLQILLRLLQLRREEGIGTLDAGKLAEVVRDLVLQAVGIPRGSMDLTTFAALVQMFEQRRALADAGAGRG